jgi:hypothetical protein
MLGLDADTPDEEPLDTDEQLASNLPGRVPYVDPGESTSLVIARSLFKAAAPQ